MPIRHDLDDCEHPAQLAVDAIVQSGLPACKPNVPNGTALLTHVVFNLSVGRKPTPRTKLRLDASDIGNMAYQTRNGVGVGSPQSGIRRTLLADVTQRF